MIPPIVNALLEFQTIRIDNLPKENEQQKQIETKHKINTILNLISILCSFFSLSRALFIFKDQIGLCTQETGHFGNEEIENWFLYQEKVKCVVHTTSALGVADNVHVDK